MIFFLTLNLFISASATYCPTTIKNGKLDSTCPRSSGSQCDFTCQQGYTKNADITALVCLGSGQWNIQGELCKPGMCFINIFIMVDWLIVPE